MPGIPNRMYSILMASLPGRVVRSSDQDAADPEEVKKGAMSVFCLCEQRVMLISSNTH